MTFGRNHSLMQFTDHKTSQTPDDQKVSGSAPSLAANSVALNGSRYCADFGISPAPRHTLSTADRRKPAQTGGPCGKLNGTAILLYLKDK